MTAAETMQQIMERVFTSHGINVPGGFIDPATGFRAARELRQEFQKRGFSEEEIMGFVAGAIDAAGRDTGLTDEQRSTISSVYCDAFEVDVSVESEDDGLTAQYQLTPRIKR